MILPLVKPSRIFQDVCAYWLMSSDGSSANAPTHHASRKEHSAIVSATGSRTHPLTERSMRNILSQLYCSGVILSAAVLQAERRISRHEKVCHARSLGPLTTWVLRIPPETDWGA